MAIIIILMSVLILYLFNTLRRNKWEYKQDIAMLHLEAENYLKTIMQSGVIPEEICKEKIKQMNKKYGFVNVKVVFKDE